MGDLKKWMKEFAKLIEDDEKRKIIKQYLEELRKQQETKQ